MKKFKSEHKETNRWHKTLTAAGVSIFFLLFLAATGMATPVNLTSLEDWEQADIAPVPVWNEGLEGLHPGMEDMYRTPQVYVLPELYLYEDTGQGEVLDPSPGLLMAWGTPEDEGMEIIAAWELVLPEDPDLTGMCITLTAWPRQGMTSISFSLKDANGVMKGWRWPCGPGGLAWDTPHTLTINASAGAGQAGSTVFWDAGIDLTQIVSFEFDESGIAQGGLTLPNGLTGFVGQWNYWHDIVVFPCPPTKLEHFSCYKVDAKTKLKIPDISIANQFGFEEGVQVKRASEICLPTDKNGEGINNPAYHLVCYEVIAKEKVDKLVVVRNQFGEQVLRVKAKVRRVCVPSIKKLLNDQGEPTPGPKTDKKSH